MMVQYLWSTKAGPDANAAEPHTKLHSGSPIYSGEGNPLANLSLHFAPAPLFSSLSKCRMPHSSNNDRPELRICRGATIWNCIEKWCDEDTAMFGKMMRLFPHICITSVRRKERRRSRLSSRLTSILRKFCVSSKLPSGCWHEEEHLWAQRIDRWCHVRNWIVEKNLKHLLLGEVERWQNIETHHTSEYTRNMRRVDANCYFIRYGNDCHSCLSGLVCSLLQIPRICLSDLCCFVRQIIYCVDTTLYTSFALPFPGHRLILIGAARKCSDLQCFTIWICPCSSTCKISVRPPLLPHFTAIHVQQAGRCDATLTAVLGYFYL